MTRKQPATQSTKTRCAIYTRVSTDERLGQEFNSLDNQRESGEAYIKSQQHEGWACLPERYDDGGFSGGNMDRPALQRLIEDIEAKRIDIVVVYKVDRLSRALLDFSRLVEIFERNSVCFVSVTQLINTSTSMGRLTLNMLLSFAQFEREMISERTRDKIAATRRKGKYAGGMPVLGYLVVATKLVVDPIEATRVQQIFALYLQLGSLVQTVAELNRRGWTTKQWKTRKGKNIGGKPFTKGHLHQLLTNPIYVGQVRYKTEVHEGEHEAIIDRATFDQVRVLLKTNGNGAGSTRNKYGALLQGILFCAHCQSRMGHTYSTKGKRRYRYYKCGTVEQRGRQACPSPTLPAGEIEAFVVDQIRSIGSDPAILAATVARVREQCGATIKLLQDEQAALDRQHRGDEAELRQMASATLPTGQRMTFLADIQDRIGAAERRLVEIKEELLEQFNQQISDAEIASALAQFDDLWAALTPREQIEVLSKLIERVEYEGLTGELRITFRPTGIKSLTNSKTEEEAA